MNEERTPSEGPEAPSLPAVPGASRLDTLGEDFLAILSQRPLAAGDVIGGRYKLIETLGNGAMGQVFVAENLSIGCRVAIKQLKAELLADATFRRRFQQEAQAVAAIEHRNVARFLDLVVGDPTFLVMEFVPGPTLASVIQKGPLAPARAISLGRRLCWALDAAHRAGVIHRDIKPANVILTPDAESGEEPKLIDFGLAKLAATNAGEALTRTGQIVGTPSYMSPEQITNRDIDARSDVYSLGCVLYEMLTGAPPFGGHDDVQLLYQQLHHEAPSPRTRVPTLPAALDAILGRALAKSRNARFQSMRELEQALAQLAPSAAPALASPSSSSSPPSPPRAGQWVRGLTLFVAGAAVTIVGGFIGQRHANGGATLFVSSEPAGAAVQIDGRPWRETTPTAVSALEPGAHEVRLSTDGYGAVVEHVTLARGGRASVEVVLPPVQRTIEVQSIPAGALVYLDGHLTRGRTPLDVTLTSNDFHEIRLELGGFEIETRDLKPESKESRVVVHLVPAQQDRATLWVDGPGTSEVYLDGVPTGSSAPTIGMLVAVGGHEVALRARDGHLLGTKRVTLTAGQVLHVAPLEP